MASPPPSSDDRRAASGSPISDELRGITSRGLDNRGLGNRGMGRGLGYTLTSGPHRGIVADPRLTARCRQHTFERVPSTYGAFEDQVAKWIATCVQSRTNDAHRE